MSKEKMGIGIIGCGRIFDLHMLGYVGRNDARVLAIADVNQKALEERATCYRIPRTYTDYHKLLEDPDIDLVEILTPHHLHYQMAMDAISARKHISLQKPPTLRVYELDEIIKEAEKAGLTLRIYENFVFYPPIVRARKLIEEGAIGQPLNLRMRSLAGYGGWEVPLESWAWRVREETCGGGPFVFDDGYHKFSIAYYLLGEVEKAYAWMESIQLSEEAFVDAPSICIWKHKAGNIFGSLDFTWSYDMYIKSKYYAQDDRIEVTGTEGIIWVTRGHGEMLDLPPLLHYREGRLQAHVDLEADWGASFRDATRHLLDSFKQGSPPRLTGAEGKKVLQFALAVITSAREKREVNPDEIIR
jgi:predicted dehydrogenase